MKGYKIYTSKEVKGIPKDLIIIKNKFGWTYVVFVEGNAFVNSTSDMKDCPEKDDAKFIKTLVKAIKDQMKLI